MNTQQALQLVLIATGALAVPLIAQRLKLFAAPCEILYGTIAATLIPAAAHLSGFVQSLGQFGFLLLLFLAGMEIDFTLLQRGGWRGVVRATGTAAGLQAICLILGLLSHWPPITVLILGAVSVSVLLVVLKEGGQDRSRFGQTLLLIAAMGEFLTIIELTGYDLGSRYGVGWPLALAALKLAVLLTLGYAALRGLSRAITSRPQTFARLVATRDPSEVGVRAALALLLAFTAVAVLLQVEQLLAAFIAGAVCGFAFRGRTPLNEKLITMGQGFFIPVFFITVGLGLNLGDVLHGPIFAQMLGLMLALYFSRLIAIPLLRLGGLPWPQTLPATLLLGAPLTLQVAIAQVGVDLGQLSLAVQSAVLGMAILDAVLFPLLARPFIPRASVPKEQPSLTSAATLPSRHARWPNLLRTIPRQPLG